MSNDCDTTPLSCSCLDSDAQIVEKKRARQPDDQKKVSTLEDAASSELNCPSEKGSFRREFNERHAGSIPLEIIKSSVEYILRQEIEGPKHKFAVRFFDEDPEVDICISIIYAILLHSYALVTLARNIKDFKLIQAL